MSKYELKNTSTFKLERSRANLFKEKNLDSFFQKISYRPFDEKWIFHNSNVAERPLMKVMQHFLAGENLGLVIGRQGQVVGSMPWNLCFVTSQITDFNLYYRGGGMSFPLYLYDQSKPTREPNLNPKILKEISAKLGLEFTPELEPREASFEKGGGLPLGKSEDLFGQDFTNKNHPSSPAATPPSFSKRAFAPLDLLDYIYATLHSPNYREKYKEFLKIDFPRVPYPQDQNSFWQLVKLGRSLRKIHLLESEISEKLITTYPADGNNKVEKISYESGRVKINQTQYFEGVALNVWEFFIGGYQPAQKWLKDRKGKILSFEEILHYQKIIVALSETNRLMKEIDSVFKF